MSSLAGHLSARPTRRLRPLAIDARFQSVPGLTRGTSRAVAAALIGSTSPLSGFAPASGGRSRSLRYLQDVRIVSRRGPPSETREDVRYRRIRFTFCSVQSRPSPGLSVYGSGRDRGGLASWGARPVKPRIAEVLSSSARTSPELSNPEWRRVVPVAVRRLGQASGDPVRAATGRYQIDATPGNGSRCAAVLESVAPGSDGVSSDVHPFARYLTPAGGDGAPVLPQSAVLYIAPLSVRSYLPDDIPGMSERARRAGLSANQARGSSAVSGHRFDRLSDPDWQRSSTAAAAAERPTDANLPVSAPQSPSTV